MSATLTMEEPPRARLSAIDLAIGHWIISRGSTAGDPLPSASQDEPTPSKAKGEWIKEASCHATMFIAGFSDASSGPLIPYIQRKFDVSYTVVSMLFVGQAVGFLISAGSMYFIVSRLGLGKAIAIGAALQALAYTFLIPGFAFAAFPVFYAVSGFGMALQDSMANVFVASLPNADRKLGYLHASYGLGAALCPLAATAFASHYPSHFTKFWCISLAIALMNLGILLYAFKFNYVLDADEPIQPPSSPREEVELEAQTPPLATDASSLKSFSASTPQTAYPPEMRTDGLRKVKGKEEPSVLRQALLNRTTILASIFILFYVGSEVSMGGWIVTFLIEDRGGGSSAGYVATGFWLGLTVGRAVLNPVNRLIGEKRIVYVYLALALALEFAVWFADSLIGNAVTVSIVGVIIGPLYPIMMSLMTKLLARKLHGPAIAFTAAFGQVGSAVFPFVTGALAQRFSPAVLQPVLVVLFGVQFVLWFFVPDVVRKKE
ncbi:MFS transporter [Sporobolomyces salmoneus]|uniref:MFS transporter n=1 Tax=Sporobolomyces salmoneus TaxID=183962 RepID=UPI003171142A